MDMEDFLYKNEGQHLLKNFSLSLKSLEITVEPCIEGKNDKCYVFGKCKIIDIYLTSDSPEDFEMPWDIIGIDVMKEDNGQFLFYVKVDCLGCNFISDWPVEKIITQPKLSKN